MSDSDKEPRRPPFAPVPVRARHDGWTPDKQRLFIEALAETACVEEACAHVGMSRRSAYTLRRRFDAFEFRFAWDAALDHAVSRLGDAALSRAIHGVPVPHYYQGELVGEHRRYDERLTMWLLRYRDPVRYGKWRDGQKPIQHPQRAAVRLAAAIERLVQQLRGLVQRTPEDRLRGPDPAPLDDEDEQD